MSKKIQKINNFPVNVIPDQPDTRDWIYEPSLLQLADTMSPLIN